MIILVMIRKQSLCGFLSNHIKTMLQRTLHGRIVYRLIHNSHTPSFVRKVQVLYILVYFLQAHSSTSHLHVFQFFHLLYESFKVILKVSPENTKQKLTAISWVLNREICQAALKNPLRLESKLARDFSPILWCQSPIFLLFKPPRLHVNPQ